ncbi:MAG: hypothetical protein EOM90_08835 [Alphaproteobacteria bacterium]|nr:hypothetical protein [Alphaproteobacteria bacterium]
MQNNEIFCFRIEHQRYAFPLASVDRVLQATSVIRIPNSPSLIHGVVDYFGTLIPVLNLRKRLGLPDRPIGIDDYFIVVDTPKRKLAVVIDDVDDVIVPDDADLIPASNMDSSLEPQSICRLDGDMVLIYDLERFLTGADDIALQEALKKVTTTKKRI